MTTVYARSHLLHYGQKQYCRREPTELDRLIEQLESQTDEAEKQRLEALIGHVHAKIEILKVSAEPASMTSQTVKLRKSSRENFNPKNPGAEATSGCAGGE